MGTRYRHTQVGSATVAVMVIVCVAALWGAVGTAHPAATSVAVLSGALVALFSTLTVIVRDQAVIVFFGPGLIRRRIPLHRIRGVRTVRSPWYYGWGIRLTPSGWMWNVSGLDGVEIEFDDGHRFRIGSDEPGKLAEVLRRESPAA
ncbi:MAG TPA: hypothetical protein VLN08_07855 [Vicinamibacterales bacterium]|nr:hypothetical protein [Vicinamibacterales bacterium]